MSQRRLEVVFGDRAARQVEEATVWWRAHRESNPEALSEDLHRALGLITDQPCAGVMVETKRLPGVRRVLLARVGYFLFYRVVAERHRLEVLAFWHARRGWQPKL